MELSRIATTLQWEAVEDLPANGTADQQQLVEAIPPIRATGNTAPIRGRPPSS